MNLKYQEVDVIIPTCGPDEKLALLMKRLELQTIRPRQILLIDTKVPKEQEKVSAKSFACYENVRYLQISPEEFDHGGTRNKGAKLSDAPILLYMTQDAVPMNPYLIEELLKGFEDEQVAAVYARQVPKKNSGLVEQYTRRFNYPAASCKKDRTTLEQYGIKSFFCSNTCAAYRRDRFTEVGGFDDPVIFGEDMKLAAKLIGAGYAIYYASCARVLHSHDYTAKQQFRRNFDNGVSQRINRQLYEGVKAAEGEGIRLVLETLAFLLKYKKYYSIPGLFVTSAAKYAGFLLGRHYEKLPESFCKKCSMNRKFWERS